MASVNLTIPDAVVQRVLDAYAATHGYTGVNGQTKAQFLKASLIAELQRTVQSYEGNVAATAAAQTAAQKAQTEISIT
jgi:hypothetical protein